MDKESIKKQLEMEDFKHIYEWKDTPGTEYKTHSHQDKVTLYTIQGDIAFFINGKTINLSQGERFDVPPQTEHSAKVGISGWEVVVGEMIEGDS